jgi:pimeloyl-ACP methyl ester carboxylesterase
MKTFSLDKSFVRLLFGMGAVLASSSAARAATDTAEAAVSAIDWRPCGDGGVGVDCATLEVPLDHLQQGTERVQLALARFPARDPVHKIGSVFLNPGGPGATGVDLVLGGFGAELATLLAGRFDIIGFDPRGVGASDGLRCFADGGAENSYFAGLPAFPYRSEQERPYFERYTALAGICAGAGQSIVSHMSTADVARDLDLLRRAVGDAKLTYLGFSYGSFLGETYANLFPDKVRAIVIDGVLDPRRWTSGLQVLSDASGAPLEFDEFLRLCDQAGPACAFGTREGAAVRYRSLAARVRIQPVRLPDGTQLSYDALIAQVVGALYAPEAWPGFAAWLAAAADLSLGRDGSEATYLTTRDALQSLLRGAAAPARAITLDSELSTICADAAFPTALGDFRATVASAADALGLAARFWWPNAACSAWPSASARYAGPWTRATSAPVLIVGNFFDGITPYADAVATSQLMPGSRLLSYAGWGHTAFDRSACVRGYVVDYLLNGSLPPVDTVCPVEANPFADAIPASGAAPSNARSLPRVGLPAPWLGGRATPR